MSSVLQAAAPGPAPECCDSPVTALRRAALAVAQLGSQDLFRDLVQQLAEDLGAAVAFIAVFDDPDHLRMRSLVALVDGKVRENFSYLLANTGCAEVVGPAFRYIDAGAVTEFADENGGPTAVMDSYAAFPLTGSDGTPLGIIVAMDRRPIADPELAESLMKIFAVRVAAELERQRGLEALRNSEASYRAIFEAVEDAVFVHDRDTGTVLDVNSKACKIEPDPTGEPRCIRTVRNGGYMYVP